LVGWMAEGVQGQRPRSAKLQTPAADAQIP
jgi:hypothetical protein